MSKESHPGSKTQHWRVSSPQVLRHSHHRARPGGLGQNKLRLPPSRHPPGRAFSDAWIYIPLCLRIRQVRSEHYSCHWSLLSCPWLLPDSVSWFFPPIGFCVFNLQTQLLLYTRNTSDEIEVNFLKSFLWWTGLIVVLAQRWTNRRMEENRVQKETFICMVTWLMTKAEREWALQ